MNREDAVPAALDLDHITMTFRGGVTAVDDVSMRVRQGEVVALLGPNGAGKTTLIDVALGLQKPQRGQATLLGFRPDAAISRAAVGVVNQTGSLPVDFTVGQVLDLFSGFYRQPLPVADVVEATNLGDLRRRKIRKLSGGEQQRLRLALALLPDPLVMFLDEPTSGMDPVARQDFWRVMNAAAGTGRTIVFATHYLAEAEAFAPRTVIMRAGRIVADAPTAELLRRGVGTLDIEIPRAAYEVVMPSLSRPEWHCAWGDGHLSIRGRDLDDAARILLATPDARNLRISDSTLEDVFTTLTLAEGPTS